MFDPRLLVGYDSSDDACVYSVSDDVAVIETVDFFTPIVDDPYLFGQIAAANALSDVYAMGGVPKLAMNLLCVPSCLPLDTVRAILEGGHDKAVEAGCVIAGGHTIQDDEPKYGLCVTGFVHPQHILKNIGAQPGDVIAAIGQLTGWDCTLAGPVEQGDGFVKVCFAQQSALFAGPPEPQKDEFHMYDAGQMCLTFLDSVARTLQANFPGKDGRALDVYYLPESGDGDLVLESIGLAIPQNTPYKAA